ncbi:hypothetical protein [Methylobacterium oryzihabitans]|uniref:Uncharacterized protein n=1 Tax=Methylobacterium oryzihabitans TaxID=2499852 RepID=A0A437NWS9_9HYPH|nr:hypothetical protein [Methylobacterium oryzihabitans]RVU14465.1 hypothetical protein EOE48_23110 [Methylobacterium oryzihabitans]
MQPSPGPELLDADQRETYASAGEAALRACLGRFPEDQQDLFWQAICRCYGRAYAKPDPIEADPILTVPVAEPVVPPAHVIDATLAAGGVELAN